RNDAEAEIDDVTLQVASERFDLVEMGTMPGRYVANIDVVDDFDSPLDGSTVVVVQATNGRSDPGPVTRNVTYNFVVDGQGPVITITDPPDEQVRGKNIPISFKIIDEAGGVKLDTVKVSVGLEDHH